MSGFLFHSDGQPDWARVTPFGVAVACIGALGAAYTAQYGYGLEPCILCLYQRIPYALAGVLALAAILMPRGAGRLALTFLCVPIFLAGGGLAFYHVGVEQHWWESVAGCGGQLVEFPTTAELQAGLLQKPEKPCDDMDWTLFGLSMTVYNTVMSIALAFATGYGIKRMRPRPY